MPDIIISGSDGFIGKDLSPKLEEFFNSGRVLYLVHNKSGKRRIKNFSKKIKGRIFAVDLLDEKTLKRLPKRVKVLIHLAASTETSEKDHTVNFLGTKNLIEALSPMNRNMHVIYTSTTAIFAGRSDLEEPIDEKTKPSPSNEYGRTKVKAEEYLIDQSKKQGFRLTILRVSTVYGKSPRKNGIFDMVKKSVNRPLGFWARLNWPGLTGLVYVGDLSQLILKFTKYPPKPGNPEVYLVCSENLTLAQIAEALYKRMGKDYKKIRIPRAFWVMVSKSLEKVLSWLERFLSSKYYNFFWRASLVVDNTLYCLSDDIKKRIPRWKTVKFNDKVGEVIR